MKTYVRKGCNLLHTLPLLKRKHTSSVLIIASAIWGMWYGMYVLSYSPATRVIHVLKQQLSSTSLSYESKAAPGKDFYGKFSTNLSLVFLSDMHKPTVYYRNACWKAGIGDWLGGCDLVKKEVNIIETLGGKGCKNNCNGQGVCNQKLGECRCFHGYLGEDCSTKQQFACNFPSEEEYPFGEFINSICPAHCDTFTGKCFCGEGTKYPNRPVAYNCGFQVLYPHEAHPFYRTDWRNADLDIFTTNGSESGWCNVDPEDGYSGKVKYKSECDCDYDCFAGRFCEIPVQCTCINQCSGHGYCREGACQCEVGWYGIDCSIPSVFSSITELPGWIRPSQVDISKDPPLAVEDDNLHLNVARRRPLIYIYDLPPKYNSEHFQGRHQKYDCVYRLYDEMNGTMWTDELYGAQMGIYESLLASQYRTLNADEADYFFVPVLDSCITFRTWDAPHLNVKEHNWSRSSLTLEYYKMAYYHIVEHYPYWNCSSGKDHIWFMSWDEGACYAPKEIWNSTMLVHWGNTNSKYNYSTTPYTPDNWNDISPDRRGNHPCFDPVKDLVLPAWKAPDPTAMAARFWARPHPERKTLFYFNGLLGPDYKDGPLPSYSMGIRQKVADEFASTPNLEGKLGKQHADDVIVTPIRSQHYHEDLSKSVFCGALPGSGWSGRIEDSILNGCIPVVIQDGIYLPYENFLNYDAFAVRIREDQIPDLIKILQSFNETEIESRLANIRQIWQRFTYSDAVKLEASRQENTFGYADDWAVEFSKLVEDDAFATMIQILHYKLHNDPWRQQQRAKLNKDYGLPDECLARTQ